MRVRERDFMRQRERMSESMCVCAFERDRERDFNCECERRREREMACWLVWNRDKERHIISKETMSRHDDKICEILP